MRPDGRWSCSTRPASSPAHRRHGSAVMTDTVPHTVLRRVERDEGWTISATEVQQAFRDDTEPRGPDIAAIVMDADGQVVHGADVLSEVRVPTPVVILVE